MSELEELKKLAEAATGGQWYHEIDEYTDCETIRTDAKEYRIADDLLPCDAAFIAAANPQTVLNLISRLQKAEAEIADLTQGVELAEEDVLTMMNERNAALERAEKAEGALKPFVQRRVIEIAELPHHSGPPKDSDRIDIEVTLGDLRNASRVCGGGDA